jgi:hypothetical protein
LTALREALVADEPTKTKAAPITPRLLTDMR